MDGAVRRVGVNLTVAVMLAFAAGCVDAVCFDRVFAVFPANQSGNAILLGIALGRGDGAHTWRPAVAIVGFGLGVALAILLGSRVARRHRPEILLALELALLVPVAVVVLDDAHPASELGAVASGVLVALTACAMGLQTEVIGRVAGIAVATTYQTGAITRMAESIAHRVAPAARRPEVARGLGILGCVLVAYVGGAAAGAGLGTWRGSLLVPMAVLVATGCLAAVAPSPSGSPVS
ncbi:MAG TPA: YoaK family protein [Acidimicrobiia bacterium]|nr:YoaK family protein [Acidimicrobiia bacterium]